MTLNIVCVRLYYYKSILYFLLSGVTGSILKNQNELVHKPSAEILLTLLDLEVQLHDKYVYLCDYKL